MVSREDSGLLRADGRDGISGGTPRKRSSVSKQILEDFPLTPTTTPTIAGAAAAAHVRRPGSPDVSTMLAKTPRPRRRSAAAFPPSAFGRSRTSLPMARSKSLRGERTAGMGTDGDSPFSDHSFIAGIKELDAEDELRLDDGDGGSESDSSIDLHTPLPHLMFRDGLLSPRSKLLPQGLSPELEEENTSELNRSRSVLSVASTAGSVMTKSGVMKDPRDTMRRRLRHRDGQLLRAGMGLTTGLGWSDSEDEDAPSTLTRRLIHTSIARRPSASMSIPRPSSGVISDVSPPPTRPSPQLSRSTSAPYSPSLRRTTSNSTLTSDVRSSNSRSGSIMSHSSATTGHASRSPVLSTTTPSASPVASRTPRYTKATEVPAALSRYRTHSTASAESASTSTHSIISTSSIGPSTPPGSESAGVGTSRHQLRPQKSSELLRRTSGRTISMVSSTSSASAYSSASGSSTQSAGSVTAASTSAVPRPLHLSASLRQSRSLSRTSGLPPDLDQSSRTLSVSQSTSSLNSVRAPTRAPYPGPRPSFPPPALPTSSSPTPTDLHASTPARATSPRPLVAGPRPKPRTGTGMVYPLMAG
ncbi:hypothetical protein WOLCODRAFT_138243 [Wolfiporia cocos MD-104 SS10]|uniref:Uncharacterized protein n=1 Tax=Wolfiporia cocos (strain MD-104) TaxID=742152 RepID=A0A2H3JNZ3_WOLCO|nr:hypothetical protein WOLCODRAFT_138243 [Wolfiporia cocos MD-104 SS10]